MKQQKNLKTLASVKRAVAKGQKEIKAGRYMTNAKADTEIEKWLRQ